MARPRKKMLNEYQPLASDSEALWAFLGVLTMTVLFHLWEGCQ